MRWLIFCWGFGLFGLSLLLSACGAGVPATSSTAATVQRGQVTLRQDGRASWYGPNFAGRRTANGEIFDPSQLTAAHKTLPFGTQVRVTNLDNGRSVTVRINDRGPFKPGRVIDLSRAAAERVGMIGSGTAPVQLEILGEGDAPSPGVLRTAVDTGLQGYSVVSARYALGTLLLLDSSHVSDPLMVRVVSNRAPQGVDLLVSSELYARLGDGITLLEP